MSRHPVAILGGTFDHLHAGHRALLEAAFQAGATVGIGLTTARYLRQHPKPRSREIGSYRRRRAALASYLRRQYPGRRWWVSPLEDRWGRSVEPGVDVLVVSAETARGGRGVNLERRRRHLPPLKIRVVPLVLGEDRLPVTSRRIRAGLIDPSGLRRRPIAVLLRALSAPEASAVRRGFGAAFPRARFRWITTGAVGTPEPAPWDYSVSVAKGPGRAPRKVTLRDASGRPERHRTTRGIALSSAVKALLATPSRAAPQ